MAFIIVPIQKGDKNELLNTSKIVKMYDTGRGFCKIVMDNGDYTETILTSQQVHKLIRKETT